MAVFTPSLHCTKRKCSLGVAVSVTVLPSWKVPPPVTEPCSALQFTVTVKLIASKTAVKVTFSVTVISRVAVFTPSLHCTKRKWALGVAEMVTDVPASTSPPPVTDPCAGLQLSVTVTISARSLLLRIRNSASPQTRPVAFTAFVGMACPIKSQICAPLSSTELVMLVTKVVPDAVAFTFAHFPQPWESFLTFCRETSNVVTPSAGWNVVLLMVTSSKWCCAISEALITAGITGLPVLFTLKSGCAIESFVKRQFAPSVSCIPVTLLPTAIWSVLPSK